MSTSLVTPFVSCEEVLDYLEGLSDETKGWFYHIVSQILLSGNTALRSDRHPDEAQKEFRSIPIHRRILEALITPLPGVPMHIAVVRMYSLFLPPTEIENTQPILVFDLLREFFFFISMGKDLAPRLRFIDKAGKARLILEWRES